MKYLEFYFSKCYQWKESWFSNEGLLKPVFRPSQEFISKFGWVNYELLESVFTSNHKMTKIEFVSQKIKEIEKVKNNELEVIHVFNEVVDLEVKKELSRIIDNLGDSKGIESPLSWNISTPLELQYIPTDEILEIFNSWCKFLKVQLDKEIK